MLRSWRLVLMVVGGGLLLLTFPISAQEQCLPCAASGNNTIICRQPPATIYTVNGTAPLFPGTYTCTDITLKFNPNSSLTLNTGAQLTLVDSLVDDSTSQFVFQNFLKLQPDSRLNLNGVTLSSPTIFLVDTAKATTISPPPPLITIDRTLRNKTVLNFTEIVLNGNAQLVAGNCNSPDPFCNEVYDIVTRDRAALTLNNIKMHNLFLEVNGNKLVAGSMTVSNIANGYGDPNQPSKPLVSFTCPTPGTPGPGAPYCSGTPYGVTVNTTYVQEFRFNVNNGGKAVLSNIGATVVDFEEGLGCDWTFSAGKLPYVKRLRPCSTDLTTCGDDPNQPNQASCCVTKDITPTACGTLQYAAYLTNVHVKEYAFSLYPTVPPDPPNNSRLTIENPETRLVETVISGTSSATVYGRGQPPSGSVSAQVQTLAASGSSQLTVTDSDMTPAATANFDTEPEPANALTGAKISITKCTGRIPFLTACPWALNGVCPNGAHAGPGTQIFFGGVVGGITDTTCGHPDDMSCAGPGSKVCAVCYAADFRAGRCIESMQDRFVITCQDGSKPPQEQGGWNTLCDQP